MEIENRAEENDNFELAHARLSMSLEAGEHTERPVEVGWRAPDDQPL